MMGKSCVDVLRDVTGDKSIETVADGLEKALSGGSALPEVTADDNGKVLTVVDGEWDKANAGGGGGSDFVVTHLEPSGSDVAGDMTYGEIRAAIADGKIIVAALNSPYTIGFNFVFAPADRLSVDFSGNKFQMLGSGGDDNNVWSYVQS